MHASPDPRTQLDGFIDKFTPEVAAMTQAGLVTMRKRLPTALEIVYDNYNALAIGFAPTERTSEAIFSIAVFPKWVSLFFLQAKGIQDSHGLLMGSGNVAKHIVLKGPGDLDDPRIVDLMRAALEVAKVPMPVNGKHQLIIRSISEKQRPRRPVANVPKKA